MRTSPKFIPTTNTGKLSISKGNIKLGEIQSLSVMPCITCRKDAPCKGEGCYAEKMLRYPAVFNAWSNNTNLYHTNPDSFFAQLAAAMFPQRFFRVHVAGDIIDAEYFRRLVDTIRSIPTCKVLMFTKQYEIVNAYIDSGHTIPDNFQIIFSNWGEWKCANPHNLPTTEVIFKGQAENPAHYICKGDCTWCAMNKTGCWELQKGHTVAFHKH